MGNTVLVVGMPVLIWIAIAAYIRHVDARLKRLENALGDDDA